MPELDDKYEDRDPKGEAGEDQCDGRDLLQGSLRGYERDAPENDRGKRGEARGGTVQRKP